MYRISEFAVYLGAFAVARGKTQASAVVGEEGERWESGNRRSGFAPVVSEGSERKRARQIAEKCKKGLLALVSRKAPLNTAVEVNEQRSLQRLVIIHCKIENLYSNVLQQLSLNVNSRLSGRNFPQVSIAYRFKSSLCRRHH